MRTVIIATALFVLAGTSTIAQDPTPSEVVDAFHAALAAGDSAAALRLLDPEVVVFESGGVERSRDEYRSHHLGADMAFEAATRREIIKQTAQVYGDLALVLSEVRSTGEVRGRTVDRVGVETMLLRRTRKAWRIVHIHWSSRH